jgi:protein SCO1/2
MNNRNTYRILWGTLAVALVFAAGLSIAKLAKQHSKLLEDYGQLPNFSLSDQNGALVTLDKFRGHVWVADLIFTHCSNICPMLTSKMLALQSALASEPEVFLASISVDPQHDTPDTLRAYATAHKADTKRWTFITGPTPAIFTLVKNGFHLPLDSVGGEQQIPIVHSPRFALVDGRGHIRGYYDGGKDESQKQILEDIENLRGEAVQ